MARWRAKRAKAPVVVPRRVGRPRIEDRGVTLTATRPWEALGMSRSSWYLRQRRSRANPD